MREMVGRVGSGRIGRDGRTIGMQEEGEEEEEEEEEVKVGVKVESRGFLIQD